MWIVSLHGWLTGTLRFGGASLVYSSKPVRKLGVRISSDLKLEVVCVSNLVLQSKSSVISLWIYFISRTSGPGFWWS